MLLDESYPLAPLGLEARGDEAAGTGPDDLHIIFQVASYKSVPDKHNEAAELDGSRLAPDRELDHRDLRERNVLKSAMTGALGLGRVGPPLRTSPS